MLLIVNADDYGYNPNCTRAITECLRKGRITNTTLMVTMPDCEAAVAAAREGGFLDRIGLHINIYGGKSLTEPIRHCPDFFGADGAFNHAFCQGVRRCWSPLTRRDASALFEEVSAQMERYISLGLPIRHFDSHHHSHMAMRVLPTFCRAASVYSFQSIRRSMNVMHYKSLKSRVYYTMQNFCQTCVVRRHRLLTTKYMCDFANFRVNFHSFDHDDIVELMVHPFYAKNGQLDDDGEMSDSGLRPMREITDFIESHRSDIQLISFADLQR